MNAILVILDSLRKDHIGAYGNDWIETPNLDALAKDSFRFIRAYPESLPTLCARRAIHTGLRTWPFRDLVTLPGETFQPAGWQPIPEVQTTLAETLSTAGYSTAMVALGGREEGNGRGLCAHPLNQGVKWCTLW